MSSDLSTTEHVHPGTAPGEDIVLAIDAAASEFANDDGSYTFRWSSGKTVDAAGMVDWWAGMVDRYPIRSVEDPLDENDWDSWPKLRERIGTSVQTVTSPVRKCSGLGRAGLEPAKIRSARSMTCCSMMKSGLLSSLFGT